MSFPRRQGGTTLVEVLAVLGIFGLLMGLLTTVLFYTIKWRDATSGRQSALQDLSVFNSRLKRQLKESTFFGASATYPSTTPATGDLVLGFPSSRDNTGASQSDPNTGEPLFQKYLIYYRSGTEIRKTEELLTTPSTTVAPLTPATLTTALGNQSERQVSSVERFMLVDQNEGPRAFPSRVLRFRVEVTSDGGRLAKTISLSGQTTFLY